MIPESLVWLIAKGRKDEAEAILQRAAKMNGRHLPARCLQDDVINMADNCVKDANRTPVADERTYTIVDLVRTPTMRKITFCISALWLVQLFIVTDRSLKNYYKLLLNKF